MTNHEARDDARNDEREALARLLDPWAFDGETWRDPMRKLQREAARLLADSLIAAGYRKHPEPEITEADVSRGASAMYREHLRRYPDEPGSSVGTAGPFQPVWRHLARAVLEAVRVPAGEREQ